MLAKSSGLELGSGAQVLTRRPPGAAAGGKVGAAGGSAHGASSASAAAGEAVGGLADTACVAFHAHGDDREARRAAPRMWTCAGFFAALEAAGAAR